MIAPTHIAFGVFCAAMANGNYGEAVACAFGALLPDIDHPKSAIGRIFFFLSQPLNLICGHRGLMHSFLLWSVPFVIGITIHQRLLLWIAIGALSHCLIDCYSTSGVKAFLPITSRTVVIFKKDWRIHTGSTQDIVLCVLLVFLSSAMNYSYALGGPRKLINLLVQSPQITLEEFQRIGILRCYAKGSFRWTDGRLTDVQWLIIGTEGTNLVYFDGTQIIREQHGRFLRSTLVQTNQTWNSIKTQGIVTVKQPSFFFDTKKWHYAAAGQKAFGLIRSVNNTTPEIAPIP